MGIKSSQFILVASILILAGFGRYGYGQKPLTSDHALASSTVTSIHSYIEEQRERHHIPGLAVAITQGDQIILMAGFGDSRAGEPVTPQTPFYIGSVSKSFTALAVMQLVERGKIGLDDPVTMHLPWFAVSDPSSTSEITIRQLLHQTSGLSYQGFKPPVLPEQATIETNTRSLSNARLTAPVGSKFQYFNPNYVVLGLVIETVSGQTYGDYLKGNILEPLGMATTFTDLPSAQIAGLAEGHNSFLGWPLSRSQAFLNYDLPAGFIISCAEDMAQYLIAQNNFGQLGQTPIISADGLVTMHTLPAAINSPYAMGWLVTDQNGIRLIQHNGAVDTFSSSARLLPEYGYGIVLLSNQSSFVQNTLSNNQIADGITSLLTGQMPSANISAGAIYTILLGIISLTFLWSIFRLIRFSKMEHLPNIRSIGKIPVAIFWPFLISILILVGIPALLYYYQGPAGIRIFLWNYIPDISFWLVSIAIFALIEVGLKIWIIRRTKKNGASTFPSA